MKVVFMGTPDFAKESLESIYNAGHEISLVITKEDKPKGRGMKMIQTPVKEFALEKGIEVLQPAKIKNNTELLEKIKSKQPDVLCIVAYGKILPKEFIEAPKFGTVNVHGSLLPKYRGAAPIQWAIINGEKTTGITTMYINEEMDEGNMLLKEEVKIGEDETLGELWQKMAKVGGNLLVKTLEQIENGTIKEVPQTGEATYAPMLEKAQAKIDWYSKKALEIKNLVRGLNPIMGAYAMLGDDKIKFWKVQIVKQDDFVGMLPEFQEFAGRLKKLEPGTVIYSSEKLGLYIKTLDDIISVEEIQAPNAKRMPIKEFLKGNKIHAGTILE